MFYITEIIPENKLKKFCQKYHIKRLSLFGSVLRNELRPGSDVDILVEFEEKDTPGLILFAGIEMELSDLIGRKVDLRTAGDLSRYFRDEVLNSAEVQYAK